MRIKIYTLASYIVREAGTTKFFFFFLLGQFRGKRVFFHEMGTAGGDVLIYPA